MRETRRHLRVILAAATQASETRAWNKCRRREVEGAEMSWLRGSCGVEGMGGRLGVAGKGGGRSCGGELTRVEEVLL